MKHHQLSKQIFCGRDTENQGHSLSTSRFLGDLKMLSLKIGLPWVQFCALLLSYKHCDTVTVIYIAYPSVSSFFKGCKLGGWIRAIFTKYNSWLFLIYYDDKNGHEDSLNDNEASLGTLVSYHQALFDLKGTSKHKPFRHSLRLSWVESFLNGLFPKWKLFLQD